VKQVADNHLGLDLTKYLAVVVVVAVAAMVVGVFVEHCSLFD
jgi:hypothetical protein